MQLFKLDRTMKIFEKVKIRLIFIWILSVHLFYWMYIILLFKNRIIQYVLFSRIGQGVLMAFYTFKEFLGG